MAGVVDRGEPCTSHPGVPGEIRARVFLLGCSRSSTTVLQRSLAGHPAAHSFPETGFFRQLGGNRLWARVALAGLVRGRAVRRAFTRLDQVVPGLSLPATQERALLPTARVVEQFREALDRHVVGLDGTIWIEKTPKHYQYCRLIRRYLPDARIIHIIRDGRDVTASIRDRARAFPERFAHQSDPAYGVREWNRALRMAWMQRRTPGVRLLRFDFLVGEPERCLRGLCRFIGVDYSPAMLRGNGRENVVLPHEQWKKAAGGDIRPPQSKFDSAFSAAERRWINRHLDWRTYRKLERALAAEEAAS